MDKDEAIKIARNYLADELSLSVHDSQPPGVVFYGVDLSEVFVIGIENDRPM